MKKLIIACAAVLVLGLGLTTVGHVLGGVVNAADKGGNVVNHHDFAMHTAK